MGTRKHKVGDKHPIEPWVWTEYAPGKFDWRKDPSIDKNGNDISMLGIKYNGDYTKVIHCDESKRGIAKISEGVTTIGECAFQDCKYITDIVLPDSLAYIDECAFKDCGSLTSVTLPVGFRCLLKSAFAYCGSIKSFKFNGPINDIPDYCFAGCLALHNVELPTGLRTIGKDAFYNCESITSLVVPEGVEVIKDGAFCNCKALNEIDLPSSLKSIGNGAFNCCKRLEFICIPENVTFIGKSVFDSMTRLKTICLTGKIPPETTDILRDYPKIGREDLGLKPLNEKVSLLVPPDSCEAYENHPYWGKFEIECFYDEEFFE